MTYTDIDSGPHTGAGPILPAGLTGWQKSLGGITELSIGTYSEEERLTLR